MEVYFADIVNPLSLTKVEYIKNGYLYVKNGQIVSLEKIPPKEKHKLFSYPKKLILPGLIDTHTHLPQLGILGIGTTGLLRWLKKYTFPEEAKFSSNEYAKKMAKIFFKSLLAEGTTTVCAFLTSHLHAAEIAFQEAEKAQIRAFLGLTLMDRGPKSLRRSAKEAIRDSLYLIDRYHGRGKLQFVVSPRYALSCSAKLLQAAGSLAKEHNLLLQTHLSENLEEIRQIKKNYPECKSYTDVYRKYNCLYEKTLLAHCVHLTDEEMNILHEYKARAIHCPTSNQFLQSGFMPLKKILEKKILVALGTDISAGYSLSLFHEMKMAIENSKTYSFLNQQKKNYPIIKATEALYLATLGAAQVLHMDSLVGNFQVGKEADFIILDDSIAFLGPDPHDLSLEERLNRIIYLGKYRILKTLISGKIVHSIGSL